MADESAYDLRTQKATIAKTAPVGVEVVAGKTYFWCVCGKSKNQPWCDGSHAGTEFQPMPWTAPETKTAYLCACKRTKNAPFCDGSHQALKETVAPAAAAEGEKKPDL
eukprot:CAMPEP_0174856442 /NCGR_PEP_ID=MMETSP1114-20130205/35928_1 /TAXON_ID=312471 /ORGANISM="Neobodo designis, Strain CCAP 1951/1" /LENGTH=107 /DNA_ID=CAMNT_0016091241 /DNA_START=46 /DNA_END=369 /DNA_ORIENTATION=+